jgi:uncharacterized protein YndB with AHSA1/START domain
MTRDLVLERLYAVPPERVWRALTDSTELGQWLMPNDFAPVLGHAFTFRMKPQRGWDGATHCQVTELEPLRRLAYSYRGEATGEKPLACAGVRADEVKSVGRGMFFELDTVLAFTLTAVAGGTRLRVEHSGFRGFKLVLASFIMGYGWKKSVLPRLQAVLDGQTLNANSGATREAQHPA